MSNMKPKMVQMRPKIETSRSQLVNRRPKGGQIRPKMVKMRLFRSGGCVPTSARER